MKYSFENDAWINICDLKSKSFVCSNCGNSIASNQGYMGQQFRTSNGNSIAIYICHKCNAPNVFDHYGRHVSNIIPGKNIKKLPQNIENVYQEARSCMSVGAYTAAIMLFRKIIMNIAVAEGAEKNKPFSEYVKFLCEKGIVHKRQTKQADAIRVLGNDANHEIECRNKDEAESMLQFIEFLLLNNYEFADENDVDEK